MSIPTNDYSTWIYVNLHDLDNDPRHWDDKPKLVYSYINWLESQLGPRSILWEFRTGDLFAQGIYFKHTADAIMFKLNFPV